jgi:hypothetical protein
MPRVMVGDRLIRVAGPQQKRLRQVLADELEADRRPRLSKPPQSVMAGMPVKLNSAV